MSGEAAVSEGILLAEFIESQRMGVRLLLLYAVGALCLVMDGFDAQGIAFAAPALIEDWHVSRASLTPVFAIGLFGMVCGSLFVSPLADRHGRRPVLIVATIFFGLAMLCTSVVDNMNQLLVMRFVTGFGLGGVMPNVLALTSEYTQARLRTVVVMLMAGAFTLGAAVAGISSAYLIPEYGWRSIFVCGGTVPLIVGGVMLRFLPESGSFLVLKGAAHSRVVHSVAKVYPAVRRLESAKFLVLEHAQSRMQVAHLFREGRSTPTILLWIISFMNLLELYFLSQWLPTLLRASNLPIQTALRASALLQTGGFLGTLLLALCTRRVNLLAILIMDFVAAAIAIGALGNSISADTVVLFAIVFAAGFCVVGGQPGVNAVIANYYPTFIRTTGMGWALGIGRFGSIVGPLVGGILVKLNWTNRELFFAAAVPSVIAAVCVAVLKGVTPASRAEQSSHCKAPGRSL